MRNLFPQCQRGPYLIANKKLTSFHIKAIVMKKIALLYFILFPMISSSQVSINNTGALPDPSSMLDVSFPFGTPKGILIPRMTKATRLQIPSPAIGLLVFQLDDTSGFYYNDFNGWYSLSPAKNTWGTSGNAGILSFNFLGTTDNAVLRFRQNNIPSGLINGAKRQTIFGYNTASASNGNDITALGTGALKNAGAIESTVAIGVGALGTVTGQGGNIAIGDSAMYSFVNAGVPFSDNTVIGRRAFKSTTNGLDNTLIGGEVMEFGSGNRNVVVGEGAMSNGSGGDDNVSIGRESMLNNAGGNKNVFIGNDAGNDNTSGSNNVGIGNRVLHNASNTSRMVAVGDSALATFSATIFSFPANTAIGYRSMAAITNGIGNTAVGYLSLYSAASDSRYNVAVGTEAMGSSLANDYNVAVGYYALRNGSGEQNVAVGASALSNAAGGSNNTALGYRALYNAASSGNTALGHLALDNLNSGFSNTAVGKDALGTVTIGEQNVAVGNSAGSLINAGSRNTFLGYDADATFTDLSNTTAIGNGAKVLASNTMSFGNTAITEWSFGMNASLQAGRALQVGLTGNPGNGAYLTDGGTWTNTSDVNSKEDFSELNNNDILHRVSGLPINRWRYKGTNEYHIGPTAQDFHRLFHTGLDDKTISTVDPSGVALAAIQALIKQNEDLQRQIDDLKKLLDKK